MVNKPSLIIVLFSVFFLVSGCVSTQSVVNRASNQYVGQSIDAFVRLHGAPYQRFDLRSGDVAYTWSSGVRSMAMPLSATTSVVGGMATTNFIGGQSLNLVCEIQIIASSSGMIKELLILRDTIGLWTTSMCHEVL